MSDCSCQVMRGRGVRRDPQCPIHGGAVLRTEERRLEVGDVVTVARPCMGNPPGARAVIVEIYDRGENLNETDRRGVTLLFPDGNFDGFSPGDLTLWGVVKVGSVPALASYRFASAGRLAYDFTQGVFANAFT